MKKLISLFVIGCSLFIVGCSLFVTAAVASSGGKTTTVVYYQQTVNYDSAGRAHACGQYGAPSSVADGQRIWANFPNVQKCYRDTSMGRWDTYESRCGGYDVYNASTSDLVQDGSFCWRWSCKSGNVMFSGWDLVNNKSGGNECMKLEESCRRQNMILQDGACIPIWCEGWASAGYDKNKHYLVNAGGCSEFRCKSLTWFASRNDRATCRSCSPSKGVNAATDGGKCYANANDARNGTGANETQTDAYAGDAIYNECPGNKYVYKMNNGRWACAEIPQVGTAGIERCWKCPAKKELLRCLQGGNDCE